MVQPEGFIDKNKHLHIYKLDKALYGSKQAPRAWYESLNRVLLDWGFKQSKVDTSLFFLLNDKIVVFTLIYVDDIVVTVNNNEVIQEFIQKLNKRFALKDMGALHQFLGIEVHRHDTDDIYFECGTSYSWREIGEIHEDDFKRWQQKMLFYLTIVNLARFLSEEAPTVDEKEIDLQKIAALDAWNPSDFLYRNYILNGLDNTLYGVYSSVKTVKALWKSLEKKYKS
ncbi:Reverse transcriptase Ty1/copia-type domain-containing protein [Abeliophyllum distichum]|uniref:Reverse transcriptase Ty1/copia-type domain-containing protein n=1 Tax=Abeliophyllum distichum TaxID=126358 RepID=A0ABD1TZM4_9LAMI